MRVIFHIGMGKTGTSSIQDALLSSKNVLEAHKIEYLGMWLHFLGIEQKEYAGIRYLIEAPKEVQIDLAERFVDALSQRAKMHHYETFIFSNEGLFASVLELKPFFGRLRELCDLRLIAYMRDPHQWLPSAYSQWGILHKTNPGPIISYAVMSRSLIHQYDAIRTWVENFGEVLTVRRHDRNLDVVADFLEQCGLKIDVGVSRHLERNEPAELLFRALYNNRIPDMAMPDLFNRMVMQTARTIPSVQEMAARCFEMQSTAKIVEEQRPLFEYIKERLGFDFLTDVPASIEAPDPEVLKDRLIDHLIEAHFQQGESLRRLERLVKDLSEKIAARPV